MRLLEPTMLAWMSLGAVALVLYLFRRKPKRVPVSTLIFFKALAREHQESSWLRTIKRLLSLLLTLLIIAAGSLALARAVLSMGSGQVESVVVLLDRSASMAAADGMGRTRLAEAIERLRQRLGALPANVEVSIIAYDERPEIVLPLTFDRRLLPRTFDALAVRPIEGKPGPAVDLAREVANLRPNSAIWHFTDRPEGAASGEPWIASPATSSSSSPSSAQTPVAPVAATAPSAPLVPDSASAPSSSTDTNSPSTAPTASPTPAPAPSIDTGAPALAAPPANAAPASQPSAAASATPAVTAPDPRFYTHVNVALPSPVNVGITAFQLRKPPLQQGRYELFAEVIASAPAGTATVEAKLDLISNRRLISTRKLQLKPGVPEKFVMPLPVTADAGTLLEMHVTCEGDVLALDGFAFARIPASKPLEVLWITPDASPFTSLALSSLSTSERELRILQGTPSTWPPRRPVDVVIFDSWVPEKWPDTPGQAVIVLNPPGSSGPVRVQPLEKGIFVDAVRVTREKHPLLHGVATGRISLTQTASIDATGSLEPLWQGPAGPILAAGERNGQRIV
ncbi:MAG TPA: BatA and WFA domain-containing protein, partial [Candidatus Methylacidiphilales bacterium]|nr:BatA and WFA domain-containing protein [Candidatus Methylacidiphilales bacterium]